jgi:hypothetical protein
LNAALGACEAGGQWRRALALYRQHSNSTGCVPDSLTFKARF